MSSPADAYAEQEKILSKVKPNDSSQYKLMPAIWITAKACNIGFSSSMESHRNPTTNTVGFSLLPLDLLEYIILKLALPDICRLKATNKVLASVVCDQDFVRKYNLNSSSSSWLFIYTKKWHRSLILYGFSDCSDRWFKVSIIQLLNLIVPPGEDLYLLTASGNFFLFALNTTQEVIVVNPMAKKIKKIPPSPLGPRGTSLWRRSGIKLLSGPPCSGHFRFLFADLCENHPVLIEYDSKTNKWRSIEAKEHVGNDLPPVSERLGGHSFLSVINGRGGSVLIVVGPQGDDPVIVRPSFNGGAEEERFVVGFSLGYISDRLHVYGDGNMVIIRSTNSSKKAKILKSVELWGLSSNGRSWVLISMVPHGLIHKINKPYGVIMGCLEQRDQGIIRVALLSNFEGISDIIWLCYDTRMKIWTWVPLPGCKILKGANMAGISFSSGLTLS